jgi:hypothetical protein
MLISHRINRLECAEDFPADADGIEFDVRDCGNRLLVQHDAFQADGQAFEEFLAYCPADKFYIVNVKAEGIEARILGLLAQYNITNFFLLDCSVPAMMKLARAGCRRLAVRFSEVESIETVAAMRNYVDWVWVDVFSCFPLTKEIMDLLRQFNLRTCLVSPELQGQPDRIAEYIKQMATNGLKVDAICAKQYMHPKWFSADVLFPRPN